MPILIAVAATLATLGKSTGVGLWAFLFDTVRFGRDAIVEWGPVWKNWTTLGVWICFAGAHGRCAEAS